MDIHERNIGRRAKQLLARFPVLAFTGARQSGKTTLARMLCPDWHYFDLERGADRDFITRDYEFFFERYPDRVILDEAQECPELFRELRGIVDARRERKGRFLITGSSAPELLTQISESLAGRLATLEVGTFKMNERYALPLSEFYSRMNVDAVDSFALDALLDLPVRLNTDQVLEGFLSGGYPEPVLEGEGAFFQEWMTHYQSAYLERDIRKLFPRLNLENYRRFLHILSDLSGTILNRSEIARSLNSSEAAVRDYLAIAEGTYLWRSIPSLEKTRSKSLVKMPRGYLRDSGLLHHLLNVRTKEQIMHRAGTGAAFEGFVIEEILGGFEAVQSAPWRASYYRTRSGAEVDLVLSGPLGQRIPVEIKFGVSTRQQSVRALSRFIEQEECPFGLIINNAKEVKQLSKKILQIPVGCL
ncbi:MAG TPA: DUF4143 domain-containing protein [Opitutales bacterium]|nr:DUF4143 domain-containing protein [Opitutales bacterium]